MYEKTDRIGAMVRVDAMLGEAKRSLDDAKGTYEYYRKEFERAQERYEAAQSTVHILENMQTELEVLGIEYKRYSDNRI